jgi:hypothetical protein
VASALLPLILVLRLAGASQAPAVDSGVRALLHGDYRTAAAALRPLSVGTEADPAAQFLLAVLLSSGRSEDFNLGGACALFSEAAKSTHVLAQPAMEIAETMREEMGSAAMLVCAGGLPPESIPANFTLGPFHTVEISGSKIVIRFNGAENVVRGGPGPGMIPLPTRYVALDVVRPVPVRRHFLLSFMWWPDRPDHPTTWSLGWTLSEVAGANFLPVTGGPRLLAINAERPPAAVDLDRLARVFVNADGDVEWNAGAGDTLQRGIVPWRTPK